MVRHLLRGTGALVVKEGRKITQTVPHHPKKGFRQHRKKQEILLQQREVEAGLGKKMPPDLTERN